LHSADNRDRGGNSVKVMVDGFPHKSKDELHSFWDTQFVDALGRPPAALAKMLLAQITAEQEIEWKQGGPDDWAMEAFNIAFDDVYGQPPLSKDALQHLDAAYVARAEKDVALQLSKAGVRLAAVLNKALGKQMPDLDIGARLRIGPRPATSAVAAKASVLRRLASNTLNRSSASFCARSIRSRTAWVSTSRSLKDRKVSSLSAHSAMITGRCR
jgi:S1/P1 Nuclease